MGWFKKKKKEEEIPSLPELPKLPELPPLKQDTEKIHKLPRLPNDAFGNKFSQDTIKEVVTGEKEKKAFEMDDLKQGKNQMFQKPFKTIKEFPHKRQVPPAFEEVAKKFTEPIFIRIDKFEESIKIFDKIKNQIEEIEDMLKNIKQLKEQEEEELANWEKEIKTAKEQVDKIDKNIFSKIE